MFEGSAPPPDLCR